MQRHLRQRATKPWKEIHYNTISLAYIKTISNLLSSHLITTHIISMKDSPRRREQLSTQTKVENNERKWREHTKICLSSSVHLFIKRLQELVFKSNSTQSLNILPWPRDSIIILFLQGESIPTLVFVAKRILYKSYFLCWLLNLCFQLPLLSQGLLIQGLYL